MIRNEIFKDSQPLRAEVIDLDAGTVTYEESGVVTSSRALTLAERAAYAPPPLDEAGALATLLAVKGILTTDDAAKAVGRTSKELVDEAAAWAAAKELTTVREQ